MNATERCTDKHLTVRTFSPCARLRTPDVNTRLAQGLDDLFVCLKSHFIIGHVFVECSSTQLPPIFSSPPASPTPLTGIRLNPCAAPLSGGPSGRLADPIPNTGVQLQGCLRLVELGRPNGVQLARFFDLFFHVFDFFLFLLFFIYV